MTPDLSAPIRAAIIAASGITSLLPAYKGSYPVFTRRPAPADAPYPMIMVSPDAAGTDADGVSDYRPALERDVIVYGRNTTAAEYRITESIAREVRALFHRARSSIAVAGWIVAGVVAAPPRPAPTDDEQTVGRVVALTVQLARQY